MVVKTDGREKLPELFASPLATSPDAQELVRQILRLTSEPQGSRVAPRPTAVVLDLEVDGARYMLVRRYATTASPPPGLSPREQEIVRLIARGLPNKAIAAVLDVSLWTVATHLRRVFGKMGVNSRAELIARVMQEGLLATGE